MRRTPNYRHVILYGRSMTWRIFAELSQEGNIGSCHPLMARCTSSLQRSSSSCTVSWKRRTHGLLDSRFLEQSGAKEKAGRQEHIIHARNAPKTPLKSTMRIFNKIDPLNLLPLLNRFVICLKLAFSCVIGCLLARVVFSSCVQWQDWPHY